MDPPNPLISGIHNRGYLPHVKYEGASYFVTFRLDDSLPRIVLAGFQQERAERIRRMEAGLPTPDSREEVELHYQRQIEHFLDLGRGACWLRQLKLSELVAGALQHFNGQRYHLGEWVVMPNHVHLIVWPFPNHRLSTLTKSWKGFTAWQANAHLGRTGQSFWQRESYDHWVRNDEELSRIGAYIRHNPVAAGLCATPEEWRWSSAWRE